MKRIQKISASVGLLVASANVLAHSGHEAIGDVLHVEYLGAFAICIVTLVTVIRKKKDSKD
jgi:hypothetical protein